MNDTNKDSQLAPEEKAETPKSERKFVSAGARIHHWATYLSVDWIYNAIAGAGFAYWGKFTESGQKIWSKPVNTLFTKTLKPLFKNEAHLAEAVKQGNTFASIIAGGMLTIPPLLALENKKVRKSIVKFIDRNVYGKDTVENNPKFQESYAAIDEAPKKDFTMGMVSRFAALAPLLALVLIKPTNHWLKENVFSNVGKASKKVVSKLGLPPDRMFKNLSEAEKVEHWNYVHDEAIAMDLSFGLPYALLHSFFYNKFADLEDKWQHPLKNRAKAKIKAQAPHETVVTETAPALTQNVTSSRLSEKITPTLTEGYLQKISNEAEQASVQQHSL
jgi:hypothetical protein